MALSDTQILERMEKSDIVIHPFDQKNLSSSSYDVTIGENYYRNYKKKRCNFLQSLFRIRRKRNMDIRKSQKMVRNL